MFYVLYPSGIVSEVALIILALPEMKVRSPAKENLTDLNSWRWKVLGGQLN